MSPTTIIEPRPLARQIERPLRPAAATMRPPVVIRPFAVPVVREIPPRRERLAAAASAW
jgi:hypothetical protein